MDEEFSSLCWTSPAQRFMQSRLLLYKLSPDHAQALASLEPDDCGDIIVSQSLARDIIRHHNSYALPDPNIIFYFCPRQPALAGMAPA
jgi:hypothetical protein